jgi:hypothetical protein
MSKEDKGSVHIYQKEYYDKILEEIKNLDFTQLEPKEIYSIIIKKFGGLQITVRMVKPKETISFFRITTHKPEGRMKNFPASFSYNPNPSEIGRANLPNEHVFYGSLHPFTCLKEMKDDFSSTYYLTEWEFTPEEQLNIGLLIANVDLNEESIASLVANGFERQVKEMFKHQVDNEIIEQYWYSIKSFSKFFSESDSKYYPISASIASNWFNQIKKQGGNIGMLMYPSVTSDNKEINLAIRKDIADHNTFKLKSVTKFHLSQMDFLGDYSVIIQRGFPNHIQKIQWKNPKYSLDKIDLVNYSIQTQCNCELTKEQKKSALLNFGSQEYRTIKDSSVFIRKEIEKSLKKGLRLGIKDLNNIYNKSAFMDFQVILELTNTWMKVEEETHQVKYLLFVITAKCSFE